MWRDNQDGTGTYDARADARTRRTDSDGVSAGIAASRGGLELLVRRTVDLVAGSKLMVGLALVDLHGLSDVMIQVDTGYHLRSWWARIRCDEAW